MAETWADIPGYEGRYQASDLGRVRSVDRPVRVKNGFFRIAPGVILRPAQIDRWGHVSVALGRGNSQGVHVLVAATFIGPRPAGLDVAHWNGVGNDNRFCNLIYATRSENNGHKVPNGKSRVTLADVARLRACTDRKQALAIGRELGVSDSYANNIRLGHSLAGI